MDRTRLHRLLDRESAEAARRNPRSRAAYERADHLFGRVPMTWMNKTAGGFPALPRHALAARGSPTSTATTYVDFCLGDTGAMAGHSPAVVAEAVRTRFAEQRWGHAR